MPAHRSKLLFPVVVSLAIVSLVSGCKKSAQETAEQNAIARHEREVKGQRAFQKTMQGPDGARIYKGAKFLAQLGENGRLPGISKDDHGSLRLDKPPAITPDGPYYWAVEFHVITSDTPPRNLYYVLVQTYSNSDFQFQQSWSTDASGKVAETYPIIPAPVRADAQSIFLGPTNPGAERGMASWFNGTLGSGSVAIGQDDSATGCSHFKIGITNANPNQTNHADLRSEMFELESAGKAHQPITLSFAYKLPDKVKAGDNIEVSLRFFGPGEANFLDQKTILIGTATADSGMTQYKTMTVRNIFAPSDAVKADVWVVANIAGPWTSGIAQFDDFLVTAGRGSAWRSIATKIGAGGLVAFGFLMIGKLSLRHWRRRQTTN